MILSKLQEALAEVEGERRALDKIESQLRAMVAELSGDSMQSARASLPVTQNVPSGGRDQLDDIADIIRAAGSPLHISVIAEKLSETAGREIKRTAIEPGMNRHISRVKNPRIAKFGRSVYGLPEWNNQQPMLSHVA